MLRTSSAPAATAAPISPGSNESMLTRIPAPTSSRTTSPRPGNSRPGVQPMSRSEEHTSELQSQSNIVCRLLLEKKNTAMQNAVQFDAQCPVQFALTPRTEIEKPLKKYYD